MASFLRGFMILGIILAVGAMISAMGYEGVEKPWFVVYSRYGALGSLGIWVGGSMLLGFFEKDLVTEFEKKQEEKAKREKEEKEKASK